MMIRGCYFLRGLARSLNRRQSDQSVFMDYKNITAGTARVEAFVSMERISAIARKDVKVIKFVSTENIIAGAKNAVEMEVTIVNT